SDGEAGISIQHTRRRVPAPDARSPCRAGSLLVLMRRLLLCLVVTTTVLGSASVRPRRVGAATPGGIRGRVMLRQVASPPAARPNVAGLGAANARDEDDRRRSVVYLESAPRGAFEQVEAAHAVMDQKNETFVPHVLAITTGSTIDFRNSDHIFHNVFS